MLVDRYIKIYGSKSLFNLTLVSVINLVYRLCMTMSRHASHESQVCWDRQAVGMWLGVYLHRNEESCSSCTVRISRHNLYKQWSVLWIVKWRSVMLQPMCNENTCWNKAIIRNALQRWMSSHVGVKKQMFKRLWTFYDSVLRRQQVRSVFSFVRLEWQFLQFHDMTDRYQASDCNDIKDRTLMISKRPKYSWKKQCFGKIELSNNI